MLGEDDVAEGQQICGFASVWSRFKIGKDQESFSGLVRQGQVATWLGQGLNSGACFGPDPTHVVVMGFRRRAQICSQLVLVKFSQDQHAESGPFMSRPSIQPGLTVAAR